MYQKNPLKYKNFSLFFPQRNRHALNLLVKNKKSYELFSITSEDKNKEGTNFLYGGNIMN